MTSDGNGPVERGSVSPDETPDPDEIVASPVAERVLTPGGGESDLADGEWHRLHPATPLLRGGIGLLAIAGILAANLRDRIIEFFLQFEERDPIDEIIDRGLLLPGLAIAIAVLGVGILGFWLAWRMREFRVTDEVVELRSGILFRTQRRARLDRVQGINIVRPLVPRVFGTARLEISVAGNDAGVKLDYLGSAAADRLRTDVLDLASGAQRRAPASDAGAGPGPGGVVGRRVGELLAPELSREEAARSSVVHVSVSRLLGSLVLRDSTLLLLLLLIAGVVWIVSTDSWFVLFGLIPSLIGLAGFIARRFSRSLRYTIAGSESGIRIGSGLASTRNETLPPGRIHSIEISQPLLWRIAGWWQIRITRAASMKDQDGSGNDNVVLPVGDITDVRRVLDLLMPGTPGSELDEMLATGLTGASHSSESAALYVTTPARGRLWRPFSWRRNGVALHDRHLLLRKGRIWRSLIVVPLARMQGVSVHQGPLYRSTRLAHVRAHIVAGPIVASVGALDADDAVGVFERVLVAAERAAVADDSHRWKSNPVPDAETRPGPDLESPGARPEKETL